MRCYYQHICRLQHLVGRASHKSSLRLMIHDAGHRHHQLRSPHRIRFLFYFCCPGLLHRFVEHFSANHVWHLWEIPPTLTFIANIAHYMCHHNPIIIVQKINLIFSYSSLITRSFFEIINWAWHGLDYNCFHVFLAPRLWLSGKTVWLISVIAAIGVLFTTELIYQTEDN